MNKDEITNIGIKDQEFSDEGTQRTILDLIDAETGEIVSANFLDSMEESELLRIQEVQDMAKKSGIHKYVCAICGQPLRLDSRKYASRKFKSYFFSHYSEMGDCPIKKDSTIIDPRVSSIEWYKKFQESKLHKDICKSLFDILENDERFSGIELHKSVNTTDNTQHWRKPDVYSSFYGNNLVFEVLMYNSFLSQIIDKNSFYRLNNIFLIWIFPYFSIDDQRLCEKDIYYTHRRNVFVFDSEKYYRTTIDDITKPQKPSFEGYKFAQEESKKQGRLLLNCYWQTPSFDGETISIVWHHKLVSVEELTFDAIKKDVFYHNCDYDFRDGVSIEQQNKIQEWERAKEKRWNKIFDSFEERKRNIEELNAKKAKRLEIKSEKILRSKIIERITNRELEPISYESDGKWGFKADDVIIIDATYNEVKPFEDGFAIVCTRHWGIIDYYGRRRLPFQYSEIRKIRHDAYLVIDTHKKRGLISTSLKELYPCKYNSLDLRDGLLSLDIHKNGYEHYFVYFFGVNLDNPICTDSEIKVLWNNVYLINSSKYTGIYNSEGEKLTDLEIVAIEKINQNCYIVTNSNAVKSVVDKQFKQIIPIESSDISFCLDRFIQITNYDGLYNLYETTGNQILEDIQSVNLLFPGLYSFKKNHLVGILDSTGLVLLEAKFKSVETTEVDNCLKVKRQDGKYVLFKIIPSTDNMSHSILYKSQEYDEIDFVVNNCFKYGIEIDASIKYFLINSNFELLSDTEFDDILAIKDNTPSKCLFVSNEMIQDIVKVKQENKYGLFSCDGKLLVQPTYSSIENIGYNLYKVDINNEKAFGVIDINNKIIVPLCYKNIHITPNNKIVCNKSKIDNKSVLCDNNGKILLKDTAENISDFICGILILTEKRGYGCKIPNGDIIIDSKYDEIQILSPKLIIATCGRNKYLFNNNGIKIFQSPINAISADKIAGMYKISILKTNNSYSSWGYEQNAYEYWGVINDEGQIVYYPEMRDQKDIYIDPSGEFVKIVNNNYTKTILNPSINFLPFNVGQIYEGIVNRYTDFEYLVYVPKHGIGLLRKAHNSFVSEGKSIRVAVTSVDNLRGRVIFSVPKENDVNEDDEGNEKQNRSYSQHGPKIVGKIDIEELNRRINKKKN